MSGRESERQRRRDRERERGRDASLLYFGYTIGWFGCKKKKKKNGDEACRIDARQDSKKKIDKEDLELDDHGGQSAIEQCNMGPSWHKRERESETKKKGKGEGQAKKEKEREREKKGNTERTECKDTIEKRHKQQMRKDVGR